MLAFAGQSVSYYGLTAWLPSLLADERGLGPEAAGRCFRVLAELGLTAGEPRSGAGVVGVVSSEGRDLERSPAFRAYRADRSEAQTYLERPKQP